MKRNKLTDSRRKERRNAAIRRYHAAYRGQPRKISPPTLIFAPLPALLSPFAAVFYPLSVLPHWMQWVAHTLPPSYVFEGMRALLSGGPFPGMLARYSAESVA